MAGDWIKFEVSTPDKPEVYAIAAALKIDPDAVVGKLLRVWAWFDQNTENGNAPIVTKMIIDRLTGVSGFADSMVMTGWLTVNDQEVIVTKFERHNGKSAKNRALTAKRVAEHKVKSNTEGNAPIVSEALPREEKRREEVKTHTPSAEGFDEWWETYPKKVKRKNALTIWKTKRLSQKAAALVADVKNRLENDNRWAAGFIPDPTTYLNQERWNDEIQGKPGISAPAGGPERPWHQTASGITAKGAELGIAQGAAEPFPYFKQRVLKAAGIEVAA